MSQRKLALILVTALSAAVMLAFAGSARASLDEGLETGGIPITDVSGLDSAGQELGPDLTLAAEPGAMVATEPEGISLDEFADSLDLATEDWVLVEDESEETVGDEPSAGGSGPEGATGAGTNGFASASDGELLAQNTQSQYSKSMSPAPKPTAAAKPGKTVDINQVELSTLFQAKTMPVALDFVRINIRLDTDSDLKARFRNRIKEMLKDAPPATGISISGIALEVKSDTSNTVLIKVSQVSVRYKGGGAAANFEDGPLVYIPFVVVP